MTLYGTMQYTFQLWLIKRPDKSISIIVVNIPVVGQGPDLIVLNSHLATRKQVCTSVSWSPLDHSV